MNQRIEKLRACVHPKTYPICTEKIRLITESFKQTKGESRDIRWAKAIANNLDKITIFIEDGELIVGNAASKPMGLEIDLQRGSWAKEEIDGLKEEGMISSEEDTTELKSLNDYWIPETPSYKVAQIYDDRLWRIKESGIAPPQWKTRDEDGSRRGTASGGMGIGTAPLFVVADYEKMLNSGLNKVIEEAEEELKNIRFMSADSVKKATFLKAIIIANKAIIRFANRFAILAAEMASKEPDSTRKKELERIATICQWVPANPARDFHEAIQSLLFFFLITVNGTTGLGRFDQYMYPFYKKDIEKKRITDAEVLELLQCLRIKDMQINFSFARAQRAKWSGMAKWHNMVIGGVTPDGKDATNELTYLVLEAAKRCQTPHHTITLRVHEGTPEDLMVKALEVVKTGIGMPAFVGDKSYIGYLLSHDVPLELARNYAIGGCLDVVLPAHSRVLPIPPVIVPKIFEIFLNNGVDPGTGKQLGPRTGDLESFESFDDMMAAFKKQLAYFMDLQGELNNISMLVERNILPDPFVSGLMVDAIKEGKDIQDRTFPFEQASALMPCGMINVADSMAAVKKLVFDEKKVTMRELKSALKANWQGNGYTEMRKMFLAAPKYGNDNDYVDLIAKELYQFFADTTLKLDSVLGGTMKPAGVSITAHQPGGELTGATPDGRYAGETLADGTMSPAQGRDTRGPIAVIKSASKIDQVQYQSTLLNMKFHPSALQNTEDLKKLSSLIKTYFSLGGKHVQFNIVNRDTLLDAQKYPEKHRDLIVRVAGYSAYFVQLGKPIQNEIIQRMENNNV